MECIIKGKAHKRYEFGVKVRGSLEFPCNPHNGHSATTPLSQTDRITGMKPEKVFVDCRFRGHGVFDSQDFISSQNHGMIAKLSCARHNMRTILKETGIFCANFLATIFLH